MRRIHLMIALFGLTAISTPAFALPRVKLPSVPHVPQTPHYTQPGHPPYGLPGPGYYGPANPGIGGWQPSGTNHLGTGTTNYNDLQNISPTGRSNQAVGPNHTGTTTSTPKVGGTSNLNAQLKASGNSTGTFSSIAKSQRHGQHKLVKELTALGQLASGLGSGQSGDNGSGGGNSGGSTEGGSDDGGQSIGSPAQDGGDILPASYTADAPPANVDSGTAQEMGMKVTQVGSSGAAAQADLRVNDIIVAASGKRTQSFEDLANILAAAKGPIELVILNGETNKLEKMNIVPVSGKIGIMTEPVAVE